MKERKLLVHICIYTFFSWWGVLAHGQDARLCYSLAEHRAKAGQFDTSPVNWGSPRALFQSFTDPVSGLRADVWAPSGRPDGWMLTLTETKSKPDTPALNHALETFAFALTDCEYQDSDGQPMSAHTWLVTGTSASLVKIFVDQVQEHRQLQELAPAALQLSP
jgi:hypothetical protein